MRTFVARFLSSTTDRQRSINTGAACLNNRMIFCTNQWRNGAKSGNATAIVVLFIIYLLFTSKEHDALNQCISRRFWWTKDLTTRFDVRVFGIALKMDVFINYLFLKYLHVIRFAKCNLCNDIQCDLLIKWIDIECTIL
jgi:hypothetical protein